MSLSLDLSGITKIMRQINIVNFYEDYVIDGMDRKNYLKNDNSSSFVAGG